MTETLISRLIELSEQEPDRECLHLRYVDVPERSLTRAELVAYVRGAASTLRAAGVQPGDLVIIIQRDLLTLVSTFFGASMLGAIPSILPFATEKLDPPRYHSAMEALLNLAQPALLATDEATEEGVQGLLAGIHEHLPKVAMLQPETSNSPIDEEAWQSGAKSDDVALLQHSSGTTGLQKGVALSHRAIFDQLRAYGDAIQFSLNDVVVSWLPLYHDMGLIAGFLMPLLGGAKLVLMSPFDWVRAPHLLLQAISSHHGTLCWLPNFAYNFCAQKVRERDLEGIDLSSMRAFINCSEPAYNASHSLFAERFSPYGIGLNRLTVCYAMAETVFAVSQTTLGQPVRVDTVERVSLRANNLAVPTANSTQVAETILSTGRPISEMQVQIVDADRNVLPDRQVGEIAVKSSYMLNEYYHRSEATEAAFYDGWYLTGDLGYLADGDLFVLGRKKDLLIVGGRNVYPQDLEALAGEVEGVHPGRVAVFGITNFQAGTEDAALIAEVDTDDDGVHSQIRAELRKAIASGSDIVVRHIWLMPRGWLVKTSSGKVARSANREKILELYPDLIPPG
jgi:acyl-CoA synthetase (AMP-forming)/AMP-acid ligase II